MGKVYRAIDLKLGRAVAIKLLTRQLANNEDAKARFMREARAASSLDHQNIGVIYEIGEHDGELFIAMALYEGRTLKHRLEKARLGIEETLDVLRQVSLGLEAAHRAGIVHRDIKPANLLITSTGTVRIVDFGLAKLVSESRTITQAGEAVGTVLYMSPEQLRGQSVDSRSDLWSLGVLAYEMLAGISPFQTESSTSTVLRILNDEPSSLITVAGIPDWLAELVSRLLRKNPAQRPQTASEVLLRLRDGNQHQRPHQLGDANRAPPRALRKTNLPIPQNALVGRRRELAEAGALVRSHRLVTLTGPGGSGKTRLALQLAAEAVEQFPDGVFWVPLQALRDPTLVERAISASLGADGGLIQHVGNKRLLVLLDNFEQVVEAAPTVSSLLTGTPNATVLVTSREPLQVESERRYPVEPLPADDAAVLFVERSRAVDPGFRPTAAVGEICRRLDGLPLAIELAAARVALLEPDQLLIRLDRRLSLLASRLRDAPPRQQTLRATIEWSYELLTPGEQHLFRRLSVFSGSFSVQAAETVLGVDLDRLESLVVKNLLRRGSGGRLGLLDTIREYALERLDESREAEDIRRRHAEFFLSLAESANLNPGRVARGGQRLHIAIAAQDNVRAALAWALTSGSIALGLRLATASGRGTPLCSRSRRCNRRARLPRFGRRFRAEPGACRARCSQPGCLACRARSKGERLPAYVEIAAGPSRIKRGNALPESIRVERGGVAPEPP
jgi:non-specific serine/threonine protein kinase